MFKEQKQEVRLEQHQLRRESLLPVLSNATRASFAMPLRQRPGKQDGHYVYQKTPQEFPNLNGKSQSRLQKRKWKDTVTQHLTMR